VRPRKEEGDGKAPTLVQSAPADPRCRSPLTLETCLRLPRASTAVTSAWATPREGPKPPLVDEALNGTVYAVRTRPTGRPAPCCRRAGGGGLRRTRGVSRAPERGLARTGSDRAAGSHAPRRVPTQRGARRAVEPDANCQLRKKWRQLPRARAAVVSAPAPVSEGPKAPSSSGATGRRLGLASDACSGRGIGPLKSHRPAVASAHPGGVERTRASHL
jgi:hypothetical protein